MLSNVAGMHMTADVQVPAGRQTVPTPWLRNAASVAALTLVLAGCGGEATEGETEPSEEVTASDPGAQAGAEEEPDDEASETNDEDSNSSDDGADSNEPVPASSDGPAENWPEPEKPDAMFEETEEGAVAALEYWWEARQYARDTGDVTPLEDASMDECRMCEHEIELTERAYQQGIWFTQQPDDPRDARVEMVDQDIALIRFELDPGAFQGFTDEGIQEDSDGGSSEPWESDVVFDGEWKIFEMEIMINPEGES